MTLLDELDVFYGETTHAIAHVYARLPRPATVIATGADTNRPMHLSGTLRGPICKFSRTLPTTVHFTDLGPGDTLLARAVMPDPCFWSAELPAYYAVQIELHEAGQLIATHHQQIGLRRLGVSSNGFLNDGEEWQLKTRPYSAGKPLDWEELREHNVTVVAFSPTDAFCRQASEAGVRIAALLTDNAISNDTITAAANVRRLAHWPAVSFLYLPTTILHGNALRRLAPNLLFIACENGVTVEQASTGTVQPAHLDANESVGWAELRLLTT